MQTVTSAPLMPKITNAEITKRSRKDARIERGADGLGTRGGSSGMVAWSSPRSVGRVMGAAPRVKRNGKPAACRFSGAEDYRLPKHTPTLPIGICLASNPAYANDFRRRLKKKEGQHDDDQREHGDAGNDNDRLEQPRPIVAVAARRTGG